MRVAPRTFMRAHLTVAIGLAFGLVSSAGQGSPLSDLVTTMEPGDWAELPTNEIDAVLVAGGASQFEIGYSEDIVWDPGSRRLFFLGGDHADLSQFISYSEDTNTWEQLPRPSWMGSGTMHGYDHSAIDPMRRLVYHRPFGSAEVHRYHVDDDSWTTVPTAPNNGTSCCDALEYFPEMDGLLWVHHGYGELQLFSEASQEWTLLETLAPGSTWNMAEYNPVHQLVVFAHAEQMYRLASDGMVTMLGTLGAPIYDGSAFNGVFTLDPVTGDHIVSTPGTENRTFHVYDAVEDSWAPLPTQPDFVDLSRTSMVGTPLSSHGVTLFVYCYQGTPCGVLLYKHAPFDPPQGTGGSAGSSTTATTSGSGGAGASSSNAAEPDGGATGCGCRTARSDSSPSPLALLLAGAVIARRRLSYAINRVLQTERRAARGGA